MKRAISLLSLLPVLSFATNGDNLIAPGAISRSLGGSAISSYIGSESIFLNPATIATSGQRRIDGGITLFMPSVEGKSAYSDARWHKSGADSEYIPYLGAVLPLNSQESIGVGLFSVSGMGVEYGKELANMKTSFKYAKGIFAYARRFDNLKVGAALHIAYARLKMDAHLPSPRGGGASSDIGAGLQIGLSYEFYNFEFGATYTSKTAMSYDGVFDFDGDGKAESLKLTQPQELSIGLSYHLPSIRLHLLYKRVAWSEAKGYREFGWKDQNVFAAGVEHEMGKLQLRGGINISSSPLKTFMDPNQAFFNVIGFPAISKRHYTIGAGYALTPTTKLHFAYVFSPKEHISAMGFEATNRQHSLTFGLSYLY